jgi:hypothetical protein
MSQNLDLTQGISFLEKKGERDRGERYRDTEIEGRDRRER